MFIKLNFTDYNAFAQRYTYYMPVYVRLLTIPTYILFLFSIFEIKIYLTEGCLHIKMYSSVQYMQLLSLHKYGPWH